MKTIYLFPHYKIFQQNEKTSCNRNSSSLQPRKIYCRCIRSLLAQNFPKDNFEIIVVDDGSNDKTAYALELFTGDITVIKNKKNKGLPASLNIALKKTKSEFFIRVDSDDFVSRNFLLHIHAFISLNNHMNCCM